MTRLSPKAVTFDCANTLVDVQWTPARSVETCARTLGIELSPDSFDDFGRTFFAARSGYESASRTRNPADLRQFWIDLHADWLGRLGQDPALAERFVSTAEGLVYSTDGVWFRVYPDVVPCLRRLNDAGLRLGVISNWDSSLHRILDALGLTSWFDVVIASLEEGVEKPDPALFALAADRLGASPADILHVGDHPSDDVIGARRAGMRALLLDRAAIAPKLGVIRSLANLEGSPQWKGHQ